MRNITVTTAKEITEKDLKKITQYLDKKYGEYSVNYVVEDELVGGIIIFDGEKIYDGSIRGQLTKIMNKTKGQ